MNTTKDQITTLIFIYNANSGLVSGLMDSAHKLLNPSTYKCDLCALTHGAFGMKKEWSQFLQKLDLEMIFYHKDDLSEEFQSEPLPAILIKREDHVENLISPDQFKNIQSLSDLILLIKSKLQ